MKILLFIILVCPLYLRAQSELPSLIENLNLISESKPECSSEDYQQCAIALCGPIDEHIKKHENSDDDTSYDENLYGTRASVETRMSQILVNQQKQNKQSINELRKNLKDYVLKDMNNWDFRRWDREFSEVFLPYYDLTYELFQPHLKLNPPANATDQFISALKVYAEAKSKSAFEDNVDKLCTPDCKEIIAQARIQRLLPLLTKFEEVNESPEKRESLKTSCMASYIYNAKAFDKAKEFQKLLPSMKKLFLEKGMSGFSKHSKKQFENFMENDLKFDFGAQSPLDLLKNSEERPVPIKPETIYSQIMISFEFGKGTALLFNPYQDVFACASPADKPALQDSFNSETKTIALTQRTCRFHKASSAIVAHELGHALSHQFSKNKLSASSLSEFLKMRQCITQPSTTVSTNSPISFKGDGNFTEEDTADLLAFRSTSGLQEYGLCFLLGANENGYFEMENEEPLSDIKVSDNSDVHSGSLVRLIREAIYKKSPLPKACEAVVRKYREVYKDQKLCL